MFLPNIPGFGAAIFTTVSCYALATLRVSQHTLQPLRETHGGDIMAQGSTRISSSSSLPKSGWPHTSQPAHTTTPPSNPCSITRCHKMLNPRQQVQSIPLSIMCGSSAIILLLGVMTRFVMAGQQARLMWYFARARGVWQLMRPCGCVCDSVCDTAAQLRLTVRRPDARKQEVNNFTA